MCKKLQGILSWLFRSRSLPIILHGSVKIINGDILVKKFMVRFLKDHVKIFTPIFVKLVCMILDMILVWSFQESYCMNELENLVKSLVKVYVRLCQDSFVLLWMNVTCMFWHESCVSSCQDVSKNCSSKLAWILQRFMQDLFKI